MNEIVVEVSGLAPAKGEAMSMLGAGHSHRPRVAALLQESTEGGASPSSGGAEGDQFKLGKRLFVETTDKKTWRLTSSTVVGDGVPIQVLQPV